MAYELTGVLYSTGKTETITTKKGTSFDKRRFILRVDELADNNTYTQYIEIQASQAKCPVLDKYQVGQKVKVYFNLRGNLAQRKDGTGEYAINGLDMWKIEPVAVPQPTNSYAPPPTVQQAQQYYNPKPFSNGDDDQLPF